jgi:thiamine phosphate synthase YjbQ (UPF0047 family)
MGVFSDKLKFDTRGEFDIIDLTAWAEDAVKLSTIEEGISVVYAGHATGIIVLNEYEPDNAAAHLRSMFLTPSRVIPVHRGSLGLGTWQRLYWVEAERRPRRRIVEITIIGE